MVGFCVTRGGKWEIYRDAPGLHGCFTTWALQAKLLDYFTVNGIEVDPYDGAIFEGQQLDQLIDQLKDAITKSQSEDINWPLTGDEECEHSHYEQMKISLVKILPPKEESVAILKRAIDLALQARELKEKLVFLGD